jgi:hypothetical protein
MDYFSGVLMRGKETVVREKVDDLYSSGALININEFHDAIVKGDCSNRTVPASVRSNLTAILGREAAYRQTELTLESLIKEGKKLEPDLTGCKS